MAPDAVILFGNIDQLKIYRKGPDHISPHRRGQTPDQVPASSQHGGVEGDAKLFCHLPDVLHDVQKGLSPFHHENIAQNVTQKADIPAKRMIFLRIHRHGSLTHGATPLTNPHFNLDKIPRVGQIKSRKGNKKPLYEKLGILPFYSLFH